jgi:hypothetical protein
METTEHRNDCETLEKIKACPSMVGDDWIRMSARIPVEIETLAREAGALQRKREVKSGLDLLRMVLAYSLCDWTFRLVGAWATIIGLGHLSDVAVYMRLRNALPWLKRIIGAWLLERQQALASCVGRVRLIDASVVSKPGSRGTDWRLHARFDLGAFSLTGVEVTDVSGGETLTRHPYQAGEIVVADRGYGHRNGLGSIVAALAYVVVRINWQNLPLETAAGQSFDLVRWLRAQWRYPCETWVWVATPAGRVKVRLVAQRLPKDRAEKARRRVRRASRQKRHTPREESLFAAGYILLISNLPAATWSTDQVLALFRLRWQVELVFKRLKSILHLDRLRARGAALGQVYLLGKLVGALLLEEWTADLAAGDVSGWFEDTERPVSPWRWTSLWANMLRTAILGPVSVSRVLAVLTHLRRYLCDAPRKRRQQPACARRWLTALTLTADLHVPVIRHELAVA